MGEMADDLIDMGFQQWLEEGLGEEDEDWRPNEKMCKYCKHGGLHWDLIDGQWRLFNASGKIHICKAYSKAQT